MTTTASKHGLRAAAKERQTKHAQRTALPARPGVVAEARDLGVGEPTPTKGYGEMTVAELKTAAKALGLVTYTLRTKGALLNAILARTNEETAAKREALAEAKVEATFEPTQPGDEIAIEPAPAASSAKREEEVLDSPSGRKANAFADVAESLGWKVELQDSQTMVDRVKATATRGSEVIEIEWEDGVFDNQTCFHRTPAGRALKLRNASHAKKRMALPPAETAREDSKVSLHTRTKAARSSAPDGIPTTPYFTDDTPDADVIASVLGKSITWINSISGSPETDLVSRPSPSGQIKIKHPGGGERSITFLGHAGFRTVRVSSIVAL